MDMVQSGQQDDETLERDGLVIYLEKKASTALDGVTIDYSNGPRKGFMIKNPAAAVAAVEIALLKRRDTMEVRVFDPPMCCSTGVCGPSVDPVLVCFSAGIDWLKAQGSKC